MEELTDMKKYIKLAVILIFANLLLSCSKIYHIEVVDNNGYLMDYWGSVCEYEIKDSTLSINDGMFRYKLKPGENVVVKYDNSFGF